MFQLDLSLSELYSGLLFWGKPHDSFHRVCLYQVGTNKHKCFTLPKHCTNSMCYSNLFTSAKKNTRSVLELCIHIRKSLVAMTWRGRAKGNSSSSSTTSCNLSLSWRIRGTSSESSTFEQQIQSRRSLLLPEHYLPPHPSAPQADPLVVRLLQPPKNKLT